MRFLLFILLSCIAGALALFGAFLVWLDMNNFEADYINVGALLGRESLKMHIATMDLGIAALVAAALLVVAVFLGSRRAARQPERVSDPVGHRKVSVN
jgi:uncharacterized iron-regulated membrane protein